MELQPHPLATIFPLLEGKEFDALVGSVVANGVFEPIVIHDGMILDGRNRYRAAKVAGVECPSKDFDGTDPVAFVTAHNIHRRHLDKGQLAMAAGRLANLKNGSNQHVSQLNQGDDEPPVIAGPSNIAVSATRAGEIMGVHADTVQDAKTILGHGTDDEIKMADDGEIGVTSLARKIRQRLSPEERKKKGDVGRVNSAAVNSELWKQLKEALELLSGLPHPSELVRVASRSTTAPVVDKRLPQSLNWLREFSNAWNQRNGA